MSFTKHHFHSIHCDEPGCEEVFIGRVFNDHLNVTRRQARMAGWSSSGVGKPDYCPDHCDVM